MQELQTIVDDSQTSPPSIDPTAFPSTPVNAYWTSSLYAPQAGINWLIDFDFGYTVLYTPATLSLVRCVR